MAIPPEELLSVQPLTGDPAADRPIPAPLVPLSAADLLVNARGEPALAHALAGEIPSADRIDLLCAFVRWHGLRVLPRPFGSALPYGQTAPRDHHGLHGVHRTQSAGLAGECWRRGQSLL